MANAVVREDGRTPGGAGHKAHVHRIAPIDEVDEFHGGIAVAPVACPAVSDKQRERMVCDFAVTPPHELADRKRIGVVALQRKDGLGGIDDCSTCLFAQLDRSRGRGVVQGECNPAEILRIAPAEAGFDRIFLHVLHQPLLRRFGVVRESIPAEFTIQHRAGPEELVFDVFVAVASAALGIVRPFDGRVFERPAVSAEACGEAPRGKGFIFDTARGLEHAVRLGQRARKIERRRRRLAHDVAFLHHVGIRGRHKTVPMSRRHLEKHSTVAVLHAQEEL